MPNIAIFLGAGASRPFGYPTTAEFMTNLLQNLHNRKETDLVNILETYRESQEIKDIEHVLEIIDKLIALHSNKYVKATFGHRQPRIFTVRSEYNWDSYISLCEKLKDVIISEIYRQYEFNPNTLTTIRDTYELLFTTISMEFRHSKFDVFTTNYDRSLEEFCQLDFPPFELIDGFSSASKGGRKFWNPQDFDKRIEPIDNLPPKTFHLRLFKLHGSLDWRRRHDGRIENVGTEERCIDSRRYKDNILIYPTQSPKMEEPFATMFKYFTNAKETANTFLVIGFSFRDPPINDIFLDFLRKDRKHRILIVSPNATENLGNFLASIVDNTERNKLEKQAIPLATEFGQVKTAELIVHALSRITKKTNGD